ncbi:hypothetical protein K1T71_005046 [Dendrolimus kikuchii]|uniref:Uncharacterized protein n=1 Tax=Dendrolimus kikuchii TaxID=765133 RepID=A0ACC1D6I3_9NEOP|nr:hypothetical protein K1T71_005046 [Dendrolimus kikuchii]
MISQVATIVTCVKIFFIPLYHSTDFEVHRNWLAITHNLTIDQWYYENTSEWTLDYPPFFAWLEYGLSFVAKMFDPAMLHVNNLNYKSEQTVLFQRLSVIVLDFIYVISAKSCSNLVGNGKLLIFILLVSNPGLLMVDHIHFQYNGFLYGFLLYSISHMIRSNYLQAALWFAVLLNLKHIYLYVAPVYIVYLLRAYCFTISSADGVHTPWYSFSIVNLIKLGLIVVTVFTVSFGPFIDHMPQVLSRLFPFKRGLCHAYWAPNFWALYTFVDKVLHQLLLRNGIMVSKAEASMTGGLVQEYDHAVLPSVKPNMTFLLTFLSMLPALYKLWCLCADRRYRALSFVRCMVVCATCSFMFGWHVHEKAILMALVPLSFLSVLGDVDGRLFLILSTVGYYSLFPLLYPKNLLSIKIFMLLTHCAIAFGSIPRLYEPPKTKGPKRRRVFRLPMLNRLESLYIYGLIVLCIYENVLHSAWGLEKSLPFLPLMITSVYCSVGFSFEYMADDEEEGGFGGLYEGGHWEWDDSAGSLAFISDLPPKPVEAVQIPTKAPTGTVEFRDDVDLIEQIRFRRRYQRKLIPGQAEVISLQDVKDVAIYTAPLNILSPVLINMLHLSTTERFIRALILCCAYYLQIADEMAHRILELETKVRTPECEILEREYRDNLADLRLLVAKEYSTMLIGGGDIRKFHHMGPHKKRRSLSDKDARLFETLLRMCVQIVWLALGRKSFNQIELEVNRMFKSEIFNSVEHTLQTGYISKMAKEERNVLLGHCVRHDKKLNTQSPLMNEVFCHRAIDYRMMGLGIIKCSQSSASGYSSKSSGSVRKSHLAVIQLYPDVVLPRKERKEPSFPQSFPDEPEEIRHCSEVQRRRWQNRLIKLLYPQPAGR